MMKGGSPLTKYFEWAKSQAELEGIRELCCQIFHALRRLSRQFILSLSRTKKASSICCASAPASTGSP